LFFPIDIYLPFAAVSLTGFIIGAYYPRLSPNALLVGWWLAMAEVWLLAGRWQPTMIPLDWPSVVFITAILTIVFILPAALSGYIVTKCRKGWLIYFWIMVALFFALPYLFEWCARHQCAC
jgi:hypothetical protein